MKGESAVHVRVPVDIGKQVTVALYDSDVDQELTKDVLLMEDMNSFTVMVEDGDYSTSGIRQASHENLTLVETPFCLDERERMSF